MVTTEHRDAEMKARPRPTLPRIAHFLFGGTLAASLIVIFVVGATLWQARQDAWQRAEQSSQNLLQGVVGHIDRHMRLYTFALALAVDALNDAEAARLSDSAKHRMLASIAGSADYVGALLVLDADGNIAIDSGAEVSRPGNFADREYFSIHRANPNMGVYISQPFRSRLRGGDPSIALSRRLDGPDGSFAGVLVMGVRLAYIDAFFANIDMGSQGVLLLLNTEGRVLARQPPRDLQGELGADLSKSVNFARMRAQISGAFIGIATVDGVERYYTFGRVPNEPLIVNVAFATRDLFKDWWWRTVAIGTITLLVCGAMIGLAVMLRRELYRRAVAEADLAFLSITDGLTGLANRRRFDEVIQREWRRTGRTGASLALLMIDVDRFKALNDAYGHARGDEILKVLARVIDESIRRPGDLGARYGGEEFAVVLPDTDSNAAMGIAETIRAKSEAAYPGLPRFSVSIGVTALRPTVDLSIDQLLGAADKALYRAKHEGRNRVVLAA